MNRRNFLKASLAVAVSTAIHGALPKSKEHELQTEGQRYIVGPDCPSEWHAGTIWFNSVESEMVVYTGEKWIPMAKTA